jgi:3'(2'), 5'-bisphosphate nucleotidase
VDALVHGVIDVARRAGEEILAVYGSRDVGQTCKPDLSPLTDADLRSHAAIVAGLLALTPALPILSEESADVPAVERASWTRYWLVDPLDGTKEFLSRNGEFTVNIALIDGHVPVLGVVYAPAHASLYYGVAGRGAVRIKDGAAPCSVRCRVRAGATVRVVGSRSHRGDSLDGFLQGVGLHELIDVGSSLKLCMIADGSADVYPRLGPTFEWDTAAAHAVVLAAGGEVVAIDGSPLAYNLKAELLNPHFLAYADKERDWLALVK